jgi:hypothetical protein
VRVEGSRRLDGPREAHHGVTALPDLGEFFDPDLHLTIGDTVYDVVSPTASEGLRLRSLIAADTVLSDAEELAEIKQLLGATWDQMLADGVAWTTFVHAGRTALLHFGVTAKIAEAHWLMGQLGGHLLPPPPSPVPLVATYPDRARTAQTTPVADPSSKKRASASGTTRKPKPKT